MGALVVVTSVVEKLEEGVGAVDRKVVIVAGGTVEQAARTGETAAVD